MLLSFNNYLTDIFSDELQKHLEQYLPGNFQCSEQSGKSLKKQIQPHIVKDIMDWSKPTGSLGQDIVLCVVGSTGC